MSSDDRRGDARELSVRNALERFMRKRQTDATDRTLRSYRSRLTPFVEYCEDVGIETVGELRAYDIDEYDLQLRSRDLAATTIKGHLSTIRVFVQYLEEIDAVEEGLSDAISPPSLDAETESSDERLAATDAQRALSFFRDSREFFGVGMHAFLELAWHTGARMGSLRALDLEDYDSDSGVVHFRHQPSTGTPLKNKAGGERLVGIPAAACEAIDTYIARERSDKRDENGRQPLFAGRQGRQSFSTLRAWSYQATQPCLWTECPHGRRRPSCEWTERSHASKCPSSRSPHAIRTGSITWQLNQGLDIETVATRVNAAPSTIRRYYDAADQGEEFEERRQNVAETLDLSETQEDDNDD
ncbi:site-specific integrase [Natronomonas marina]|uniref:tyrosine-type recombinase/integrase n=1 Tax=Natronomonas marina TaxID=2961939 RepID=UPI0020C9AD9A|nr:tyrosine-type recombinase/integrase [Natronomonas marina]